MTIRSTPKCDNNNPKQRETYSEKTMVYEGIHINIKYRETNSLSQHTQKMD